MSGIVDVRDWITMYGDGSVFHEVKQEIEESIETTGAATAVARLETLGVSNATVYLEGSDDGQNYVSVISTAAAEDTQQVYLSASANYGTAGRLFKYLRWRIAEVSASAFYATFRIRVILTSAKDGSRRVATGRNSHSSGNARRTSSGVIYFQPWISLEAKSAGSLEQPVQPMSQWLDTSAMPGCHIIQTISYLDAAPNAGLKLESSPYPADLSTIWTQVTATTRAAGTLQFAVSNESSDSLYDGGGYLRWRMDPTTPANEWAICFRIEVVPGAQVEGRHVQPRRG